MSAEVAALADPENPTRERPSTVRGPGGARRRGSCRPARVEADAEIGTATSSPPTWSNREILKSGSRAKFNLDGAIREFNLLSYCRVVINTRSELLRGRNPRTSLKQAGTVVLRYYAGHPFGKHLL